MSFGLGHGKTLDDAIGTVGVELPALPDEIASDPLAGMLDPREWFVDPGRRFEIEIGSGKGTFLLQQAGLEPETNFLGIEWAKEFYLYAADRVRRRGLANVRMLHADATQFLRWRMPDSIMGVVHLYFSDPWPKKRHHKKRVVQDRFLADLWRVLMPGGEFRVVTDHDELWAWNREHFDRWCAPGSMAMVVPTASPKRERREDEATGNGQWAMGKTESDSEGERTDSAAFEFLPFAAPESAGEEELVGTNFERKFRQEGRSFHACVLRKRDGAVR